MQKTKLLIGMQRSILVHLNVTSPSLLRRRQTLFRLICLPVFATSNDSRHIIPAGCRFKFWVSDFTALWFGSEEDQSVMRGKAEHMDVRSKAPRKKKTVRPINQTLSSNSSILRGTPPSTVPSSLLS